MQVDERHANLPGDASLYHFVQCWALADGVAGDRIKPFASDRHFTPGQRRVPTGAWPNAPDHAGRVKDSAIIPDTTPPSVSG